MGHNKAISINRHLITNNDHEIDLILASLYCMIDKKDWDTDEYVWSVYKDATLQLMLHIKIQQISKF